MQLDSLGTVEKKVLGAMLILADDNHIVNATAVKLADVMGYKRSGGAITFAIRILEINNFIVTLSPRRYRILI
jgi:hypothetical protein